MCDEFSDILMTYNPECLERYSDTSDFDDDTLSCTGTTHSSLRRKVFRRSTMANYVDGQFSKKYKNKHNSEFIRKDRSVHPRHCACKDCVIPVVEKNKYPKRRQVKYLNEGNINTHVQTTPSRLSMVRSKIIPCLSNIFSRNHTPNHEDLTTDKHIVMNSTKDNYCQVYSVNCNHKRIKRPTKRVHNFAMQLDHSSNTDLHDSPDSGINVDSSHKYTTLKDSKISCTFTSSSISENIHAAKVKFKKMIEKEIMKSCVKKQLVGHVQEQQFPSRPNFQVYTAAETNKLNKQDLRDMSSFGYKALPSNSSVFWEYLVDRINKKYQNKNKTGLKSCHCASTQQCPNPSKVETVCTLRDVSGPKLNYKPTTTEDQGTQDNFRCSCSCKNMSMNESPIPSQPKVNTAPKQSTTPKDKLHCKCHRSIPMSSVLSSNDSPTPHTPSQGTGNDDTNRQCQEPHDLIKASLENKYNGEILCIHNPPCILINGCLNLPPVKVQESPVTWPMTQRSSFHCGFHKEETNILKQEQACQYQYDDLILQHKLEYKTEKMTQSICNHDPPCEVVRCCYKPELDSKLENSCVHVPMCQRLPECILNESVNLIRCDHEPKCAELPACNAKPKKYIVLTAANAVNDNIGTQVKPNIKMVCKHEPPCIMIPKCLGKLMYEGYVPYEAIPDCVHKPSCELIPACCRKSAKMNSFFRRACLKRKQRQTDGGVSR